MKATFTLCLIFFASIATARETCTEEEFSRNISKGLPAETELIVRRIIECKHWSEEIGDTDPERTKQIEMGIKKAKCETLEKDRAAFIKTHPKLKKMEDVFSTADAWYGSCK